MGSVCVCTHTFVHCMHSPSCRAWVRWSWLLACTCSRWLPLKPGLSWCFVLLGCPSGSGGAWSLELLSLLHIPMCGYCTDRAVLCFGLYPVLAGPTLSHCSSPFPPLASPCQASTGSSLLWSCSCKKCPVCCFGCQSVPPVPGQHRVKSWIHAAQNRALEMELAMHPKQ